MANDLMPVSGADSLALPSEPITPEIFFGQGKPKGLEEFTHRELGLEPQLLQIIHNLVKGSPPTWHAGDYRIGQTAYTDPLVVFLKGHHIRTLLEGPENRPRTVCASADGRVPHDGVPEPKSDNCTTCPYGQWRDGTDGRPKAPPCQPGIALLGVIVETTEPFWMLCRKTATKAAQAFGRAVGQSRVDRMSDLLVRLQTDPKTGAPGSTVSWCEPVFEIVGRTGGIYDQLCDFVQDARYVPPATAVSAQAQAQPEAGETWEVPV
jgi:hypothetical protein